MIKARQQTSFLFDLDGTLLDSVYDHVLAWHDALQEEGIEVSVWRLHRKIGMSGSLFTKALARETGREFSPEMLERLRLLHLKYYNSRSHRTQALPGARELLAYLTDNGIPWAIATSGRIETAGPVLAILGVDPAKHVVITRDLVRYAKPDPDLFLAAAWKKLPGVVEHTFTHFHLELAVWVAKDVRDGELRDGGDYRWTARAEIGGEALPTVMRKVVAHVIAR